MKNEMRIAELEASLLNIKIMRSKYPEDKNLMEACDWREGLVLEELKTLKS